MKYFQWTEELSVNIEEIDNQHQQLVSLMNNLSVAIHMGKGDNVLGEILTKLSEYATIHFATEERLMKIHGYPDLANHKKEHHALKNHVLELNSRLNAGQLLPAVTVSNFLKDWIVNHFQQTDMKFGPFLNDKGVL